MVKKRKKKKQPHPSSKYYGFWLKLGVLAFILYIFYKDHYYAKQAQQAYVEARMAAGCEAEAPDAAQPQPSVASPEKAVGAIGEAPLFVMRSEREGRGVVARCGDTVKLRYVHLTEQGEIRADHGSEAVELRLGDPANDAVVQAVALGMRAKAMRQVTLAGDPSQAYNVEMEDVLPRYHIPSAGEDFLGLRNVDLEDGEGRMVSCGDRLVAHYRLFDHAGDLEKRSLVGQSFRLGDAGEWYQLPYLYEGMREGGRRLSIIPASPRDGQAEVKIIEVVVEKILQP